MSVPLGHKKHKIVQGQSGPRVYYSKPRYVYEVDLVDNPILGRVYKLTVVDSNSPVRKNSERFIWKAPKWKRNALLSRTFNNDVPKYNDWKNKGLTSLLVGNDGHLYTDEGETFYRVHQYKEIVDHVIVPEGVKTIAKGAFEFVIAEQICLPLSLTTIPFGSFTGTYFVKELKLASPDLVFSNEGRCLNHIKVLVPNGSINHYQKQFEKHCCIVIEEY